jgi:hypothetical protein
MTILLIVSAVINIIFIFSTINILRKVEVYEDTIQQFYSALSITLHNMRAIDERQMFENDDEVGVTFQNLTDIVNELRPLLYEKPNESTRRTSTETE